MNVQDVISKIMSQMRKYDPRISYDEAKGILMFATWDGDDLHPPVRLHLDNQSLADHLSGMRASAVSLWPDVPWQEGALQLLTIHLQEIFDTRKPGQVDLVLDKSSDTLRWLQQPTRSDRTEHPSTPLIPRAPKKPLNDQSN